MNRITISYSAAISGYFGLLLLQFLWYIQLSPPEHIPISVALVIAAGPLLFPLRGILYGRPYTFAWTGYLALLYFIHGVMEAWSSDTVRHLALLEVLFSVMMYTGCIFFARFKGQALKADKTRG